jgi:hypothetical protein
VRGNPDASFRLVVPQSENRCAVADRVNDVALNRNGDFIPLRFRLYSHPGKLRLQTSYTLRTQDLGKLKDEVLYGAAMSQSRTTTEPCAEGVDRGTGLGVAGVAVDIAGDGDGVVAEQVGDRFNTR